jgi:hypothetical protein
MGNIIEVGAFIATCALFLFALSGGGDGNYPGSKGS